VEACRAELVRYMKHLAELATKSGGKTEPEKPEKSEKSGDGFFSVSRSSVEFHCLSLAHISLVRLISFIDDIAELFDDW
jgi:hypothetical protein